MSSIWNTLSSLWNGLRRAVWVSVMVFMSACTATDSPRAPLADARIAGDTIRPALDRLLSPGEVQVAEEHLRAFGYDPGPVDGRFTAQTQAAIRAFQARYGLRISGRLDRETRRELLPGLDQDGFDP